MKKKIALLLSTILMVLVLGACGADPTAFEHKGATYDSLYKTSNELVTSLSALTDEQLQQTIEYYETQEGEEAELVVEWCTKWLAAKEIAGDYVGVVENSFTLTKSGKTVTTSQTLKFSKREVTFELVYNYFDMEMTGATIEPVYSMGEKMEKAALNTVICMSIVFAVLILISLIISCFKIFPYLEKRKAEKAKAKIEVSSEVVSEAPVETPQLTDDTELVAVIAAAIAASTGTSTSDFVVRSIRRR